MNLGRVIGVLFTRRLSSSEVLTQKTCYALESIHDSRGSILQLISLNVDPAEQHHGYGEVLLRFVLTIAQLTAGIERVLGVTRCRDFGKYCTSEGIIPSENVFDNYVEKNVSGLRESRHGGVDATLRFHTLQGAEVLGVVPGYRPLDLECCGAGVLIEYSFFNEGKKVLLSSSNSRRINVEPELKGQKSRENSSGDGKNSDEEGDD